MSRSSNASLRELNCRDHNVNSQRQGDLSTPSSARNSISEISKGSNAQVSNSDGVASQSKSEVKQPVFADEISSSVEESPSKEEGLLDNCGIIPNNCLPCLASTVPSVEKRRSLNFSPPRSFKKASSKLSFKWRDGHTNSTLCEYLIPLLLKFHRLSALPLQSF